MTDEEILATADACGMMLFGLGLDKAKFEFCILAFAKLVAAKNKERTLQLIKELRPSIKPLEGMGKGKTTDEWFDILVKDIEEKNNA